MDFDEIAKLLDEKANDLGKPFPLEFRFPEKEPRHPLEERPKTSWPAFNPRSLRLKKNDKNWFYTEIDFPKMKNGIELRGKKALCFVNGWIPFTAWLDGQELWKETHAWHATGPIADPFPVPMHPGHKHQLILCIEPTEVDDMGLPIVSVSIHPEVCMDLAWDLQAARMQIDLAKALAKTSAEKRLVEKAVACLDLRALKANRWPAVEASITKMETVLAPLSNRARELTVHLIGHAHIDMDWLWTWSDTVHCIRRDFRSVTELMDKYLELTFTHSQVPTYDVVRHMDPDVFRKMRHRIAEGRWENAAGTWVEGDLNMADGESIARHMLYASDWTKKHLDSKATTFWAPDTFGHPGNMPQLAKLGELDSYFHMRCNPGKPDTWPARKWTGIDGTSITAFTENYNGDLTPRLVMSQALHCLRNGLKNSIHLWGIGDHGGALSRWQLEMLKRFRFRPIVPTIRFSTMKEMLAAVEKEKPRLPGNKGETPSSFEGCFSVHSQIKRYNRLGESALLTAEALTMMSQLDRRDALREAWKPILFNQFHDIFDGCAVHDTYFNAHKRAEGSLKAVARITRDAVSALVKPTGRNRLLTILNPTGFERTEPVRARLPRNVACLEDAEGKMIPVQKLGTEYVFISGRLPAFSHTTYKILTKAPATLDNSKIIIKEEGPNSRIESRVATSVINRNSGAVTSYFDKRLRKEFVVPAGMELALNVFQIGDESPRSSAWVIGDMMNQQNMVSGAKVELMEVGPVFARFKVTHKFRSSSIEEDVIYYRDYSRVDFEARIDWHEKGSPQAGTPQLKVSFASSISAARLRTEGPYVVRELPADGQETVTQKWADLTGDECGFAVYNDSKYGMDALGGRMRLLLLRNSFMPDRDTDGGSHVARFAFEPHGGKTPAATLIRNGIAFNRPLIGAAGTSGRAPVVGSLHISGADSVVCTAMRMAEHSNGVLMRLFESSGKKCKAHISLNKRIVSAKEVNFLENPTGGRCSLAGGSVTATFHPFEVKTLLVKVKM